MIPSISVVVPAYNRFSILVRVIQSILDQTVPVHEILVVDDGSQDETEEELPQCILHRPGWLGCVRYIRQANQGQSAALNRGIAESSGQWIGFSGHDDLWLPWKLEWQIRAISESGPTCGLCFTDAWFMNNPHMKQSLFQSSTSKLAEGPVGKLLDPVSLVTGPHPIWVQTVIAKKDLIRRVGMFDPYLRYSEDHDFLFRMALVTRFCYVNMPLVLIDRSPADIRHTGASRDWHRVEFCLQMDQHRFEKQLKMSDTLPGSVRRRIRQNLRSIHSHWATFYLETRQFDRARNSLQTACGYHLSLRLVLKRLLTASMPRVSRAIFVARGRNDKQRLDRTSWMATESSTK
jgi:glycosyltransferase involved in cell wall biosynthesis